jgi:hypothetical protein
MNTLSNLIIAISSTMMFIGLLFLSTGTQVPFFDTKEEVGIEFEYSGQNTTLHFEQKESQTNNGWAVYSFGEYLDDDGDGFWDDCGKVQISLSNDSEENFFFSQCENSTTRGVVDGMVYVGQLCFNPSNESSSRCSEGNYSFESNLFVRLSQELEENEGKSLFSRFVDWLVEGLASGRTILCGSFPLLILGILISIFSSDEEEESVTKVKGGPTAEWRAYSLTGQERGDDGLPKAFSRHSEKKDFFRKPRKGNTRGGVHKTGGLYLEGWTDEDSDAAYKKKVEDRRQDN